MSRSTNILLVLVALFAAACASQPPSPSEMQLFLLAGQSNMAGRGEVEEIDRTAHPRVLMLTKDLQWVPATEPLHFDKPHRIGVGPGLSFARAVVEQSPSITIGLIPSAAGGSPIDTWTPGGYHDSTDSHPWDDAIRRTKFAMQSGELKAILWHQGEADSKTVERARSYENKLADLVRRFRVEFDSPNLPFFIGQLGRFATSPWDEKREMVDTAHRTLPDKLPGVYFVPADGLTDSDGVHFDSASARELGKRYAEAWIDTESVGQ